MCPSLENDGGVTRAFGVGECAYSLCTLVFKASEELVELLHSQCLEEPFPREIFELCTSSSLHDDA